MTSTSLNSRLTAVALASLVLLLPLEIFLRYDTVVRQVALTLTNIVAIISVWALQRRLRRAQTDLPWVVVWFVALGVWFDALGNFVHFYARFWWWDKLAHVVGTAAVALALLVVWQTLEARGRLRLTPFFHGLMAVSVATTLAALYEVSEYIGDKVYPTNRVTDLFDTADDLLWNFLAAVVAVLIALWAKKRSVRHVDEEPEKS